METLSFRNKYSSKHAIISLTEIIENTIDNKQFVRGVLFILANILFESLLIFILFG